MNFSIGTLALVCWKDGYLCNLYQLTINGRTHAIQTYAESINHFLNRFEYPFRGLIYKALLNYASVEVLSGQNTSLEPYLQYIASYDSEGTVSADEAEQALENAVAAFPFSLEGAKGEFTTLYII